MVSLISASQVIEIQGIYREQIHLIYMPERETKTVVSIFGSARSLIPERALDI